MTDVSPPLLANSRSLLDEYRIQVVRDSIRFTSNRLNAHFSVLPLAVFFSVERRGRMNTWLTAHPTIVYARDTEFASYFTKSPFFVPNRSVTEVHAELWKGRHEHDYGIWLTLSETSLNYAYVSTRTLPIDTCRV